MTVIRSWIGGTASLVSVVSLVERLPRSQEQKRLPDHA
jgi:hypothetical protein